MYFHRIVRNHRRSEPLRNFMCIVHVFAGAGFMNRRKLCQLTAAILTSDLTTRTWVLRSDKATIM